MANRFTDSMKWDDAWFMGLSVIDKLVWFYICDKCDHAGVWKVNEPLIVAQIGAQLDLEASLRAFGERIELLKNTEKWLIKGFIGFQYKGQLNPANKAHKGVLSALEKHGLSSLAKGLVSPSEAPAKGPRNRSRNRSRNSASKSNLKPISESLKASLDSLPADFQSWPIKKQVEYWGLQKEASA